MQDAFDFDAIWTGRVDPAEGDLARRWHQAVRPWQPDTVPGITLQGFACDAGVARNQGRTGASAGPTAIRRALANLASHEGTPIFDAGDVVCEGDALEKAQAALGVRVREHLSNGEFPIVLGGGHEVAWASGQGVLDWLAQFHPTDRLGILNLDAHFDLRRADRASSGTPFLQYLETAESRTIPARYACLGVATTANTRSLFQTAENHQADWILDHDLQTAGAELSGWLERWLGAVDHVHLSIDLDVLPAATMPGVSAPAALGVPLPVILTIARQAMASGKVRLAELAELNPSLDIDARSARTAARIVHDIASLA